MSCETVVNIQYKIAFLPMCNTPHLFVVDLSTVLSIHYPPSPLCTINLFVLLPPPLFLSINCPISSFTSIPCFGSSSHASFLSPLVPTPLFFHQPSCLNNAVATQQQCHCPRFNVNVVSLSQLLGHYHPSKLIIVIQTRTNKTHHREQRSTNLENKGAHDAKSCVVVCDAHIELNDEL